jgi:hypothetical protein
MAYVATLLLGLLLGHTTISAVLMGVLATPKTVGGWVMSK